MAKTAEGQQQRRQPGEKMPADIGPAEPHEGRQREEPGNQHDGYPVRHRHGEQVLRRGKGHRGGKDGEQQRVLDHPNPLPVGVRAHAGVPSPCSLDARLTRRRRSRRAKASVGATGASARFRRQARFHAVEHRVQLAVDLPEHGHDGDADTGGDDAIFDGRPTAFVLAKRATNFCIRLSRCGALRQAASAFRRLLPPLAPLAGRLAACVLHRVNPQEIE